MTGLIIAVAIMAATALIMCAVYKRDTGHSLPKDLFHDILRKLIF